MSMHHVLSVVCFSAGEAPCGLRLLHHLHLPLLHHHRTPGLIFDRAHFYAAFDGCCETSTVFLNTLYFLKTVAPKDTYPKTAAASGLGLWCAPRRHGAAACRPPRNSHLTPRTRCRLGFVFFRLILFPAWLYMFISDMRNHPEQTWDLMNGFERYGYILSKHRRRTPAPPPALRTRLSEHICVSQPVAQPTSCCSRCR